LQAFAAITALGISVWAALRVGAAERRRYRVQTLSIAVAIYPEILKLEVILKDTSERLGNIVSAHAGKLVGQSVGALIHSQQIAIPPMLERNVDRLFMLGEEAGPSCLELVNVLLQYNEFVEAIAGRSMMMDANQWAEGVHELQEHLRSLEGVLAKCERDVGPLHGTIKK